MTTPSTCAGAVNLQRFLDVNNGPCGDISLSPLPLFPLISDLLTGGDLNVLVSNHLFEATPALFEGDRPAYIDWKTELAARLHVDPFSLLIVGSGGVGISLNPGKLFKPFNDRSDVDIAVVSPVYFDEAWRYLRNIGARKYRLPAKAWQAVKKHEQGYVYWGTIATDRLLPHLPFGPDWVKALEKMRNPAPTSGRWLNVRLYRDIEALRDYQRRGLSRIRDQLLAPPGEV